MCNEKNYIRENKKSIDAKGLEETFITLSYHVVGAVVVIVIVVVVVIVIVVIVDVIIIRQQQVARR